MQTERIAKLMLEEKTHADLRVQMANRNSPHSKATLRAQRLRFARVPGIAQPGMQVLTQALTRRRLLRAMAAGAVAIFLPSVMAREALAEGEDGEDQDDIPVTPGPQTYRLVIPGLAMDGEAPPPPPPPPPPPAPPAKYVAPTVFYTGDRNVSSIYLTMDDCWSLEQVADAMGVAEQYDAHLTFFVIGTMVTSNPAFWRAVVQRGHAVENHTFDHAYLSKLTSAKIREELRSQSDAVAAAVGGGYRPMFMRPPGGDGIFNFDSRLPIIAQELGMKIAMWNSDSNGWRVYPRTDQAAVDYAVDNVFSNFGWGSIVIQHALAVDVLALPVILQEAATRGYTCLTLREGIV